MAGAYKTCTRCGAIFVFRGKKMCDKCIKEMDDMFVAVRDYIYKYPNATVVEVLEEIPSATEQDILDFLKEGRLEMKEAGDVLKCEKCGVNVRSGRLCESCKKELSSVLSSGIMGRSTMSPQSNRDSISRTPRGAAGGFKSNLKDR